MSFHKFNKKNKSKESINTETLNKEADAALRGSVNNIISRGGFSLYDEDNKIIIEDKLNNLENINNRKFHIILKHL